MRRSRATNQSFLNSIRVSIVAHQMGEPSNKRIVQCVLWKCIKPTYFMVHSLVQKEVISVLWLQCAAHSVYQRTIVSFFISFVVRLVFHCFPLIRASLRRFNHLKALWVKEARPFWSDRAIFRNSWAMCTRFPLSHSVAHTHNVQTIRQSATTTKFMNNVVAFMHISKGPKNSMEIVYNLFIIEA